MSVNLTAKAGSALGNRAALVVPRPRSVVLGTGSFAWTTGQQVAVDPSSPADRFAVELLREQAEARSLTGISAVPDGPATSPLVIGQRHRLLALHDAIAGTDVPYQGVDGYWLRITANQVVILGESAAGVYYGVQTLVSLLPDSGSVDLPCLEISDCPGLRIRGFMQDYGRKQVPTLDTLKHTIERMGALKLNTFFPYFEDAFHFKSHPEIAAGRDRHEPEEMAELVEFARLHHVRVIPVFQGLGHMDDILASNGLEHLREREGSYNINPVHPGTATFFEEILADACAVFPDPLFHAGFDETFGIGKGAAADVTARIGEGRLFLGQVRRIQEILERHGKRMIIWSDQAEEGFFRGFGFESAASGLVDEIPRDVILSPWHYGAMPTFEAGELFDRLGFEMIIWGACGHLDVACDLVGTDLNARSYIPWAHKLGLLGGAVSQWENFYDNTPFDTAWPCLAIFAEALWHPEPRPLREVVAGWLWREFGEAGAELLEAFVTLGSVSSSIPWGGAVMTSAAQHQFFSGPDANPLEPSRVADVDLLAQRIAAAGVAFEAAASRIQREPGLFDLWQFSLEQTRLLVAMIRHRHAGAAGEVVDATPISVALELLVQRYQDLWALYNRPLNLPQSIRRYRDLLAAYQEQAG